MQNACTLTLFNKVIQGHFSQGHEKFGELAGLQCADIAVYAAAFTNVEQISRWTSDTLDSIIEHGHKFFESIGTSVLKTFLLQLIYMVC